MSCGAIWAEAAVQANNKAAVQASLLNEPVIADDFLHGMLWSRDVLDGQEYRRTRANNDDAKQDKFFHSSLFPLFRLLLTNNDR